ncbi:MAG: Thiol-disulfide oxidoreductase ResA [Polaribacter sp. SA4-10]|nr:MAG: Thiol-disulfide oxidoreductase ResA [Polaribacter sp. SA4-10]
MKVLAIFLFSISILVSCVSKSTDYATITGRLENNKDSLITIGGRNGIIKTIKINTDGTFKDTLKVNKVDIYTFQTSRSKRAPIYLKNGFNINLTGDSEKFMSSFKYSGNGSDNSNYILSQIAMSQSIGNPELILKLDKQSFDRKVARLKKDFDSILNLYKNLDSALSLDAVKQSDKMVTYFQRAYSDNLKTSIGSTSPTFSDYMDYNGGKKSLNSFLGKYVYIDVWATWCGPCIQQIPSLEKLMKEYKNKNIEFISISTDDQRRNGGSWDAAEKKWRSFIKKRQMGGTQLWIGKDNSFQQAYKINSIPRFILIDPKGNIVDANAPRPSDPRLKSLFTSLGI